MIYLDINHERHSNRNHQSTICNNGTLLPLTINHQSRSWTKIADNAMTDFNIERKKLQIMQWQILLLNAICTSDQMKYKLLLLQDQRYRYLARNYELTVRTIIVSGFHSVPHFVSVMWLTVNTYCSHLAIKVMPSCPRGYYSIPLKTHCAYENKTC